MTEFLKDYLPATDYLQVIGFGVIFFLTFLVCSLSGWAIKLLFKKSHLGWLDRTLGAALAVLKGVVIAYLVIWLLILFVPASAPLITKSRLVPVIRESYQSIVGAFSSEHYTKLKMKIMEKGKVAKPQSNREGDRPE
jgi:membrane protein required for colicin V production